MERHGFVMQKKVVLLVLFCLCMAGMVCGCGTTKKIKYTTAISQLDSGKYDKAKKNFLELGDYENAPLYADECDYKHALECMENGDYAKASELLQNISDYTSASDLYVESEYKRAGQLMEAGQYDEARNIYDEYITYEDSVNLIKECDYLHANAAIAKEDYENAVEMLKRIEGYKDADSILVSASYAYGVIKYKEGEYYDAYMLFENAEGYKKANKYLKKIMVRSKSTIYKKAVEAFDKEKMQQARKLFKGTGSYKDSKDYLKRINLYYSIQGVWECQTRAMENIGSKYTLSFSGWNCEVTIRQGYTTDNKESTYSYTVSNEYFKKHWCVHYGEDTYYYLSGKKNKKLVANRGGKDGESYKKIAEE